MMKFDTYTNLNMLKSMMLFNFSVLDHKYPFLANLVQSVKIACLNWKFGIYSNLNELNLMVLFSFHVLNKVPF